jgi:hypothetical protein
MEQDIFILVMSCIWAFAGYRIALGKGRSPWLGVALGFLLGLIGLLILAFVPKKAAPVVAYTPAQVGTEPWRTGAEQRVEAA